MAEHEKRRLAAVMMTDVYGYSRLSEIDESGTRKRLNECLDGHLLPAVSRNAGRIVKSLGDGALVEFASAVEALRAAVEFQQSIALVDENLPSADRITFRVGLHLGDVLIEHDDIQGNTINIASRLESKAPVGGVLISKSFHDAVTGRLPVEFEDAGELTLKNIVRPIQAFRVKWNSAQWEVPAAPNFEAQDQFSELTAEVGHVEGLRTKDLDAALGLLSTTGVVEVVGPAGVGKTSFIRELLRVRLGLENKPRTICTVVLVNSLSLREMLLALANEAGLAEPDAMKHHDETRLLNILANADVLYWVRDYDAVSQSSVRRLTRDLNDLGSKRRALWIVESVVKPQLHQQLARLPHQIHLLPLDDGAMRQILERRLPGAGRQDLAEVLRKAEGIPRWAIWYWMLDGNESLPRSERLDQYELFALHLEPRERRVLAPLAYILDAAPLGVTLRLLEAWSAAVDPLLAGDRRTIVRSVVRKMWEHRLVSAECFGVDKDAALGESEELNSAGVGIDALHQIFLPNSIDDARFGLVQILDPHFIEYFIKAASRLDLEEWATALKSVARDEGEDRHSLTGVTLALLGGDLRSFASSSFRSSAPMIPRILSWVQRAQTLGDQSLQRKDLEYFSHWLEWINDHYWDDERSTSRAWKLKPPLGGGEFQSLLYNIARTRSAFHRENGRCDWEAWAAAAAEFLAGDDLDLWAEAQLRRAQALLREPSRPYRKVWDLMRTVLEAEGKLSPAGRGLMYFHVLSFLNKRRMLRRYLPELAREAESTTRSLVGRMILLGERAENLNSIANAIFFLVRSMEEGEPPSIDEVTRYVSLLRFVQRVSRARRIQAIVTEGSVHRHYLRRVGVTLQEFALSGAEALRLYEVALDSAERLNIRGHFTTTLSYCGQILGKGLEFKVPQHWLHRWSPGIQARLARVLDVGHQAQLEQLRNGMTPELLLNLNKHYMIQSWIAAVVLGQSSLPQLQQIFASALAIWLEISRSQRSLYQVQHYYGLVSELGRAIEYTEQSAVQVEALRHCEETIRAILTYGAIVRRNALKPNQARGLLAKEHFIRSSLAGQEKTDVALPKPPSSPAST